MLDTETSLIWGQAFEIIIRLLIVVGSSSRLNKIVVKDGGGIKWNMNHFEKIY
jgi:hypothetical protein